MKTVLLGLLFFLAVSPAFAQIGNVTMLVFPGAPSGACSTTQVGLNMSNGALSTCNNGAWAGVSGGGLPTGLTFVSPTFTVSSAGNGNGCVALSGNTSGTATLCAPPVAGTSSNPVAASNAMTGPNGGCTVGASPTYSFASGTTSGLYWSGAGIPAICVGSNETFRFASSLFEVSGAGFGLIWNNSTNFAGSFDLGLFRQGAGVAEVSNSSSANSNGVIQAAAHIVAGTKFTTNAGCSEVTTVGGASAGKITTVGSTSCTTIVTMGNSATAPNGWACTAHDLTTSADYNNPHVSSTTTTATIVTGTIVAADVIEFSCIGY